MTGDGGGEIIICCPYPVYSNKRFMGREIFPVNKLHLIQGWLINWGAME
jgi:hypothetical protein